MDFSSKLRNLRLSKNLTQEQLASIVNVSVITVRNWESGSKSPNMKALTTIGKEFNISIDYMLGLPDLKAQTDFFSLLSPTERKLLNDYQSLDSHGRKLVETVCAIEKQRVDCSIERETEKIISLSKTTLGERYIRHYTTPSAAGLNVPLDESESEMVLVNSNTPAGADFSVTIQGESMKPYINDGDVVYIKRDAELSIGDVGIFAVDGAMYCKQYYMSDNKLILVSANPELKHTNITVSPESGVSVKCYGKVILENKIPLPSYLFED